MSDDLTPEEREVKAALRDVEAALIGVREEIMQERRTRRRYTVVVAALAVIGLVVGCVAGWAAWSVWETQRAECVRGNEFRAQVNALADAVDDILVTAARGNGRTVEQQAQVDEFLASARAELDEARPAAREC